MADVKHSTVDAAWEEARRRHVARLIPPARMIRRVRAAAAAHHQLPALPTSLTDAFSRHLAAAKPKTTSTSVSAPASAFASSTLVVVPGVDLRSKFGLVYDQGQVGSCTANAIAGAYRLLETDKSFEPSRMYIYAKERLEQDPGQPLTDSGSDAAIGLDWIQKHGVCPESVWRYEESKVNVVPPASADEAAKSHKLRHLQPLCRDQDRC
jgi:hypothetical protein